MYQFIENWLSSLNVEQFKKMQNGRRLMIVSDGGG